MKKNAVVGLLVTPLCVTQRVRRLAKTSARVELGQAHPKLAKRRVREWCHMTIDKVKIIDSNLSPI